ncbi:MAG: 2-phospho-L-lactate transferase, partial [Planctomycetota bacterium]
ARGRRLTEVTRHIAAVLGVRTAVLPMSDDRVETHVLVMDGRTPRSLHFQEYLVQRGGQDAVRGVEYRGSPRAGVTPEIRAAMEHARAVIIAPSNPVASIGPILAVPGLRDLVRSAPAPVVAVSPIVGGRSLKGPSDKFLRWAGVEVSPLGVARLYLSSLGRLDGLVIDRLDEADGARIGGLGVRVHVADTMMTGPEEKRRVARSALAWLEELRCPAPRS